MKKMLFILFLVSTTFCHSFEKNMEMLISSEEISAKIQETAKQIKNDYEGKNLTILMVIKGAILITADLIRTIDMPCKLDYIIASSYGHNGMVSGELTIYGLEKLDIEGRDVLIVDDIFDTGKTIMSIKNKIKEKNPSSIKTLTLLVKDVPREINYRPDYVLFDIPNRFVIGYGLDYKEYYRGLPGIYAFINDTPPF